MVQIEWFHTDLLPRKGDSLTDVYLSAKENLYYKKKKKEMKRVSCLVTKSLSQLCIDGNNFFF